MNRKKHIMVFEAFTSKTLSKTTSFLNKEIGKESSNDFLRILRSIGTGYDIPIDKINDNNLEYLTKRDAVNVRKIDSEDIYCLKFWFSIDNGYLGYTYTGNIVKKETINNDKSKKLTFSDLETLNIKTGKVITLDRSLSSLNTGDKVIGIFSDEIRGNEPDLATVFINDEKYYAIQNSASGSSPDCPDSNWDMYGKYTWYIGKESSGKASDNFKLSKYIDDGSILSIDSIQIDGKEVEKTDNILEFNLPLSGKRPTSWSGSYDSISLSEFESADFAIIFYIGDIINSELEKPSKLKSKREDSRKNAAALLDNESIKQANIERYISIISKGFGLNYGDELNPKNLQKIVGKLLNRNLSLYNIGWKEETRESLSYFINDISNIIIEYKSWKENPTDRAQERIERRYDNIAQKINRIYNGANSIRDNKKINDILSRLEEEGLNEEYKICDRILNIGNYIYNSIMSKPINTIEDLSIIKIKIESIFNLLNDDHLRLTRTVSDFLSNLRYNDNDSYTYISSISKEEGFEITNKKIDKVENYIKSIL